MKRTLYFIACVLTSLTMSAQDGLAVEDIEDSGCLSHTRGGAEPVPTIVLQKEGSVLSVQLLNYTSQCLTENFVVKNSMSEGSNGVPSLTVDVYSNGHLEADCMCPYNVSFTIRDIETNTFYLKCWWYEGLVTLEEGKPFVLEDITLYATIDGVNYTLKKTLGTATLTKVVEQKSKMIIPAELNYKGQSYAVKTIDYNSFRDCTTIKNLEIPESVSTIYNYSFYGCKLDTLIIRGLLDPRYINSNLLYGLDTDMKVFVQPSEVEKYKAIYGGPVYPLSGQYYYYYRGNKIPLTRNENTVIVSIPKENKEVSERIKTNVLTLASIWAEAYYIYAITRTEYEKLTLLDFWAEDSKSIILSSSYFTERNDEVYESPYLNVQLKKEEDIDLLTSYAEQYKLTIFGNSPLMPLWYILAVTPESEKSPLDCANELYESGNFASSAPDLVDAVFPQTAYRPFVEEGKVWKVGDYSGNPVQRVEYYYFDGDTIIDGKTCKQMMCQRYVNAEHPDYANISQLPSLSYVGAWYEEGKKVYFYNPTTNQFKLMYDFSLGDNETLQINNNLYVVGPKQTGEMKGFKGVYRDVMMKWDGEESIYNTTWLEGVGGIDGPTVSVYLGKENHVLFLMSCTVGDEVIYFNDEYEDGTTTGDLEAKKHRFDFTHTIKTRPKAPKRREVERQQDAEMQSLYGEYNERQLGINLNPLDEAYIVRITNESGNVVYEKAINAGSIVALNIDISAYAKGRYTVTMENSHETFSGEFDTQTTGIKEVNSNVTRTVQYYSIDGKRIATPQQGLNIIRTSDGKTKKVVVK